MATPTYQLGSGWIRGGALNLQPKEKTVLKRNGIAERTSIFKSDAYPTSPPIPLYTPYPNQSTGGFVCDTTEIVAGGDGFWLTTVVWVSIFAPGTSYTTYDSKMIQVPIDQSPDFTTIAGSPDDPQNGAIFDANGIFIGFAAGSDYQGVVSAYIEQDLMVIHGSGTSAAQPSGQYFCESIVNTLRGQVWEYEITYNLDIDIATGLPRFDNGDE